MPRLGLSSWVWPGMPKAQMAINPFSSHLQRNWALRCVCVCEVTQRNLRFDMREDSTVNSDRYSPRFILNRYRRCSVWNVVVVRFGNYALTGRHALLQESWIKRIKFLSTLPRGIKSRSILYTTLAFGHRRFSTNQIKTLPEPEYSPWSADLVNTRLNSHSGVLGQEECVEMRLDKNARHA